MAQVEDEILPTNQPARAEITTISPANSITFTLPCLPPSINSLYQIIWSQRRIELKPECRLWKSDAKQDMPRWELSSASSLICIDVAFHHAFHHANARLKTKDVSNLLKLLIDAVAEKYGFDDARVKQGSWDSVDSKRDQVIVTVTEVSEIARAIQGGELTLTK